MKAQVLKGRTALVTGASSGIGEACARVLAEAGANLLLWARREKRLEALSRELMDSHGVQVSWKAIDLRDRASVVAAAEEFQGRIDILINNAGLARGLEKLHEGSFEDWEEMVDTNIKGLLAVSRAVVPRMLEGIDSEGGYPPSLISIGSIAGMAAYAGGGVYCGTKAAVRFIDDGLRLDTVDRFFRVCTIQPGMVDTEFSRVRFHGDQERARKVYQELVPLSAEDVADAVLWVLTRPAHVQVSELTILPTCQASGPVVHRGRLG